MRNKKTAAKADATSSSVSSTPASGSAAIEQALPTNKPESDRENVRLFKSRARDLTRQQSYHEAIAQWQEVQKFQGLRADSCASIVRLYAKLKEWDKAYAHATAALSTDKLRQNLSLLKLQGHAALFQKDYPAVVRAFTAIADVAPNECVSAVKRLVARRSLEPAAHILAIVLSEHPSHLDALAVKPSVIDGLESRLMRPGLSAREYASTCRLLLALDPRHQLARQKLRAIRNRAFSEARDRLHNGELDAAEQAFNDMLSSNPLDPAALRGLTTIDKARKDWNALAERWKLIARAENSPERVVVARARALAKAQRPVEALEVLATLPLDADSNAQTKALLTGQINSALKQAKASIGTGDVVAVLRAASAVLAVSPEHQRARSFSNWALAKGRRNLRECAESGRHEEVISQAQELLKAAPDDVSLLRHLCRGYAQTRAYAPGLPWFKRLAELDRTQATNWLRYAVAARSAGNDDEAIAAAREALRLDPQNVPAATLIESVLHRRLRRAPQSAPSP